MCFEKLNHRSSSRMLLASIASLSVFTLGASAFGGGSPIPGLYNTGVNNNGTLVADGSADPHYTLTVNPQGGSGPYITNQSSWQFAGAWATDNAKSKWISPQTTYISTTSTTNADPGGTYTYQTTFDLPANLIPSTATISGQYVVDNQVAQITLNGVSTNNAGRVPGNANTLNVGNFTISSGFIAGVNTLDFIVDKVAGHGDDPSGIQIENMVGTATDPSPVPEPASLGLISLAVVGLASRRRARQAGANAAADNNGLRV